VAVAGSFLNAVAFLKLGHATFFGPRDAAHANVKEPPWAMLFPMLVLAAVCVFFGIHNSYPINHLIAPMLPQHVSQEISAAGTHFSGWPSNPTLVAMTAAVLLGAVFNHWFGVKLNGGARHASDHISESPGLRWIYEKAERRCFDPYELFMKATDGFAKVAYKTDRANDWLFGAAGRFSLYASKQVRAAHTGNTSAYIVWSLLAATAIILYLGQ